MLVLLLLLLLLLVVVVVVVVTNCRRMLTHDLLPVRFIQDCLRLIQKITYIPTNLQHSNTTIRIP
jgi:hypothetical protein